jgi:hypothetical protein
MKKVQISCLCFTLNFPNFTRKLLGYLRPDHDRFLSYPVLFDIELGSRMWRFSLNYCKNLSSNWNSNYHNDCSLESFHLKITCSGWPTWRVIFCCNLKNFCLLRCSNAPLFVTFSHVVLTFSSWLQRGQATYTLCFRHTHRRNSGLSSTVKMTVNRVAKLWRYHFPKKTHVLHYQVGCYTFLLAQNISHPLPHSSQLRTQKCLQHIPLSLKFHDNCLVVNEAASRRTSKRNS